MKKFVPRRVTLRSTRATLDGGASQRFPHFLTKLGEKMKKQKLFGSARRVTRLAGSLLFDSLVTLLAGQTILHVTVWLAQPSQLS